MYISISAQNAEIIDDILRRRKRHSPQKLRRIEVIFSACRRTRQSQKTGLQLFFMAKVRQADWQ
jgi:hypothetical protein